jgi:flagellar biosynthesis/type III secretory pathway M-ring protein FliF/YscJ
MDRRELVQKRKRIGRKAIATVRVAVTIDRKLDTGKPTKRRLQFRYEYRKWHLYTAVAVVVLVLIGIFVINTVSAQVAKQKADDQARQQKIDEEAAKKRDACRQKITSEKANQLGTITYDQLYGNQCQ